MLPWNCLGCSNVRTIFSHHDIASGGVITSLSQPIPLTVSDCRGLVKTLVCGMKTITWGVGSCKVPGTTVDFCESIMWGGGLHYIGGGFLQGAGNHCGLL